MVVKSLPQGKRLSAGLDPFRRVERFGSGPRSVFGLWGLPGGARAGLRRFVTGRWLPLVPNGLVTPVPEAGPGPGRLNTGPGWASPLIPLVNGFGDGQAKGPVAGLKAKLQGRDWPLGGC